MRREKCLLLDERQHRHAIDVVMPVALDVHDAQQVYERQVLLHREAGLRCCGAKGQPEGRCARRPVRARWRSSLLLRAQVDQHDPYRCAKACCVHIFTKGAPNVVLARCARARG
jgi:hypothetical protein